MIAWIEQFKNSSPKTKWFIFNCIVYGMIIVFSTLYCYARLDYVRSGKSLTQEQPL